MASEEGSLFAEAVRRQSREHDLRAASQYARDEAHRTFDARFDQIKGEFLEAVKGQEGQPIYSGTSGTTICAHGWRLPGGRRICFQPFDEGYAYYQPRRDAYHELALTSTGELWLVVQDDQGRTIGRKPAWAVGGDRVYVGPTRSPTAGYTTIDPQFGFLNETHLADLLRDVASSLARRVT